MPQQKKQLTCASCGKAKDGRQYFVSYHAIHNATGKLPYCKKCLNEMMRDSNGNIIMKKLHDTLKLINRPYVYSLWDLSIDENAENPFGTYMKNLALRQNRDLTWNDSVFEENVRQINNSLNDTVDIDDRDRLVRFWGGSWEDDELFRLEKFYVSMVEINQPETPQDDDYIKKIARLSVQIDKAIESGEATKAKSLGDLYSKYMADAKLRTTDTTDADKSGGIRRFCDVYTEVEKDDFIPPWFYYRKINGAKQDIVDKVIVFILNFMLKFNKQEKLSEPPTNTPKIEDNEIDEAAQSYVEMVDLEVDSYE